MPKGFLLHGGVQTANAGQFRIPCFMKESARHSTGPRKKMTDKLPMQVDSLEFPALLGGLPDALWLVG
ncbi:hypothetical protein I79_021687 [Cricetulus griseus]|uniref:Uncharacterized protein n=1 Tax=Cricetulus griseus TaxID=10029 RepID=G3IDB1_CRIGR|nr:hypothetical protein I79_021687 [Cricetulus griseus]